MLTNITLSNRLECSFSPGIDPKTPGEEGPRVSQLEEGLRALKRGEGVEGSLPVATSVNCGAHNAASCEACPQVMMRNRAS